MNKILEGYICNNQCAHIGKKENNFSVWFSSHDRINLRQGQTYTTGLILFSLFLLLLFF
jgi:hypothetical protein